MDEEVDKSVRPIVHVEAVLLSTCSLPVCLVESSLRNFLANLPSSVLRQECSYLLNNLLKDQLANTELAKYVQSVSISDLLTIDPKIEIELDQVNFEIHVYHLTHDEPGMEAFTYGDGDSSAEFSSASHWILPSIEFHGIWDNLIYENNIKKQLLNYVMAMLLYSDRQVDSTVITWNRVVLLHGPPGSGKTSLCRALAQKLCIRLNHRYRFGQLIEINSHSLFSKWFSESGKLVMKLFQNIKDIIEDSEALVIILIDEVESLTHARKSAMAGMEPSDAIRVVNAVLTQIDCIRRYPNVLILTTSNITGAIDLAFVDRADIKQYIGLPSAAAIYQILHSCVNELMRTRIITPSAPVFTLKSLELMKFAKSSTNEAALKLYDIAQMAVGLSGRMLRKLPLVAHALYIESTTVTLDEFLDCLKKAVKKAFLDQKELGEDK